MKTCYEKRNRIDECWVWVGETETLVRFDKPRDDDQYDSYVGREYYDLALSALKNIKKHQEIVTNTPVMSTVWSIANRALEDLGEV